MATYSDKLKNPKWQKKRLKVFERANWKCELCSDSESELHVHHLKYTGEPWDAPIDDLQCLCKDCHLLFSKHIADGHLVKKVEKTIKGGGNCFILIYDCGVCAVTVYNNRADVITFGYNSEFLEKIYKYNTNGK